LKIVIPSLIAEYSKHIDQFRAIPYYADCLKPIERRLLLSLHDEARTKFVKCARVVGSVMAKYHPHGDASSYESLVNLIHRGFAFGQGNFGYLNLDDITYSQMRYTECKANKELDEILFEFIKFIPHYDPDNIGTEQPVYLTAPIPVGLVGEGYISGIGGANSTKIPKYSAYDLLSRLTYLLKLQAGIEDDEVIIQPTIKNCTVTEKTPGVFKDLLTTGRGTVEIKPIIDIHNNTVYILGKSPRLKSALANNEEELQFNCIDLSTENSPEKIYKQIGYKLPYVPKSESIFLVAVEPKHGKLTNQFVTKLKNVINTTLTFTCNIVQEDGLVKCKGIDELLLTSYYLWAKHYEEKLNNDLDNLHKLIFELKVIELIREIITKNNVAKIDDVVNIFKSQYQSKLKDITTEDIRQTSSKHTIKKLIEHKTNTQSILKDIAKIKTVLSNIEIEAYEKTKNMFGFTP
jgi:hypothetical protein